MNSEVARLREQLQLEAEAAFQGLHGYASVAQHQIIRLKMLQVDQTFEQLLQFIEEDEAELILVNAMEQAYQIEQTYQIERQKEQQNAVQGSKSQKKRSRRHQ